MASTTSPKETRRLPRPCVRETPPAAKGPEFVAQVVHIMTLDRVCDFVGLFDRVRPDRIERLHHVPGAACLRIAERGHDVEQALNVAGGFHGSVQRMALVSLLA